jgi:PAS domain S-box-containing protein
MKDPLRILFVEDSRPDAELIWHEISKDNIGFEKVLVETKEDYVNALISFNPDLIISDYSLPQFDGMQALSIKKELLPDVPFLLVTGSINEEIAVKVMKAGADDYLIKQNLSRLGSSIRETIKKRNIILEKSRVEEALVKSERIFSAFMEYSPVYFFFKDQEAKPVRLSHNFEKMLGIPAKEAIGKSMYDLFPKELAKKMIEDDLKVMQGKIPLKVVEELNGKIFETTKFPIHVNENTSYLAGFTLDITDQKNAEKALIQKIDELEKFNELTVDRELKMIELKKEINELLKRLGEKEKYKIVKE